MRVKMITEANQFELQDEINNALEELEKKNKKIIDIKFTDIPNGDLNALILYEEKI